MLVEKHEISVLKLEASDLPLFKRMFDVAIAQLGTLKSTKGEKEIDQSVDLLIQYLREKLSMKKEIPDGPINR